jgi:hypothetical protein
MRNHALCTLNSHRNDGGQRVYTKKGSFAKVLLHILLTSLRDRHVEVLETV